MLYKRFQTVETDDNDDDACLKNRKTDSMTKKRSSEIFGAKMDIFFLKKGHSKILSAQLFSVLPNSAPSLRPCPKHTISVCCW